MFTNKMLPLIKQISAEKRFLNFRYLKPRNRLLIVLQWTVFSFSLIFKNHSWQNATDKVSGYI